VICFDEVSLHKGHGQYVLVISTPELGLVLDVLPNRDKETLEKWLDERGKDWCAAIEVACSDMGMPTRILRLRNFRMHDAL
jgi:transposase